MSTRAVFLDLNGTIVEPIFVQHPGELSPVPGAIAAVARLSAAGFVCPVVTIQSRIAKGMFSLEEFERWFETLIGEFDAGGARIVGPYVCPHRFAEPCACKKPNTLLYEQAAAEHGIDLARSFVIGDSRREVEAATRFGGRGCLVRTGFALEESVVEAARPYAAHIAASVSDAADWILQQP